MSKATRKLKTLIISDSFLASCTVQPSRNLKAALGVSDVGRLDEPRDEPEDSYGSLRL